jgi:hypothetical protein
MKYLHLLAISLFCTQLFSLAAVKKPAFDAAGNLSPAIEMKYGVTREIYKQLIRKELLIIPANLAGLNLKDAYLALSKNKRLISDTMKLISDNLNTNYAMELEVQVEAKVADSLYEYYLRIWEMALENKNGDLCLAIEKAFGYPKHLAYHRKSKGVRPTAKFSNAFGLMSR